ncbi:T9SS type A sorting domain-containing protein [Flammeovirga sp. SJP92]|uniref:T9SS type A sorting domain-containing protein n=1 Tax=Flammeovirga sp. SJP92 TaxID=1775430 RepID=UPI0009EF2181|nr:T9SS type A sorting domain-containing protein [Flammeovirga sp. SJP92]
MKCITTKVQFLLMTSLLLALCNLEINAHQRVFLSDWEQSTLNFQASNNASYTTVNNPSQDAVNSSSQVGKFVSTAYQWDFLSLNLSEEIDFENYPVYKLKVRTSAVGTIMMKFEDGPSGSYVARYATPSNTNQWEELTFDFSGIANGNYGKMIITFDYTSTTAGVEWYLDDFVKAKQNVDTTRPTQPQSLSVTKTSSKSVSLQWNASSDNVGVIGYVIYKNNTEVGRSNTTSFEVSQLNANSNYTFTVSAYDLVGNESGKSNTVNATTQNMGNGNFITSVSLQKTSMNLYDDLEVDIQLNARYSDPYNPNNIKTDMVLITPSGKELVVPCFYYSGVSRNSLWKGRFTPQETGQYQLVVDVEKTQNSQRSGVYTFTVNNSYNDGFLHTNEASFYNLKFDSDRKFRGIGENFAWEARLDLGDDQTFTYDYFFQQMKSKNANFIRTWMCPWNLPLEWKKTDFGRYTDGNETYNLSAIARMDWMLDQASQNGIYIMLTLDYHGALLEEPDYWGGNNYWWDHNYYSGNGGPISDHKAFFTNESAKQLYKNRLRYIIARWGYHTNIGAIELFNEVDNLIRDENFNANDIEAWHNEMSTYLKSIDPYNHIVTTSITGAEINNMFHQPNLDLIQSHPYGPVEGVISAIQTLTDRYNKPYVAGEFADDWVAPTSQTMADYQKSFHRGLWTALFQPTPILPMTWWWEDFTYEGFNDELTSVSAYSDIMLNAMNDQEQTLTITGNDNIDKMGVKAGDKLFVYFYNKSTTTRSPNMTISGVDNELYYVTSFNTTTGIMQNEASVLGSNRQLVIGLQNLQAGKDIAYIIQKGSYYLSQSNQRKQFLEQADQLKIYPNPSTGIINLEKPEDYHHLTIYTALGREVLSVDLDSAREKISLSDQEKGVYLLKFFDVNGNATVKKVLLNK